jgi:type IV pilus assembly protein PilY1
MVFFGTGDRENPRGTSDLNTLYAIKDFNPTSILTESHLVDVTEDLLQDPNTSSSQKATIREELKTKKGWYIRLNEKSGEKCLSSPVVFNGGVYYTTYVPTFEGQDVCHLGGGQGNIYLVNYKTGNALLNLDPTNDLEEIVIMRSDRKKVIGAAIPSDTIISVVAGKVVGYVGIGGGIYVAEIINKRPIIPLNWKMIF